jgi:peptidoglycan biosynthesis protein MviN/MurJ (putative lipid II flippase)
VTPLIALAITVVVEAPIVALLYPRERVRMALTCALTTSATNLAMNLLLYPRVHSYMTYLLVGEIAATLIEAAAYLAASRQHDVGRALLASALANGASFSVGLILVGG